MVIELCWASVRHMTDVIEAQEVAVKGQVIKCEIAHLFERICLIVVWVRWLGVRLLRGSFGWLLGLWRWDFIHPDWVGGVMGRLVAAGEINVAVWLIEVRGK